MAIGLQNTDNVNAPGGDYQYGRVRDNDGTDNGTPANTKTLGDFHQFFARMMHQAGMTPNGLPDNDYSGYQYFEALKKIINPDGIITRKMNIGDWNMDTTVNVAVALPAGVTIDKVIGIEVYILSDPIIGIVNGSSLKGSSAANTVSGYYVTFSTGNEIVLNRIAGGDFDNVNYSSTGYNRGFVIIKYIP